MLGVVSRLGPGGGFAPDCIVVRHGDLRNAMRTLRLTIGLLALSTLAGWGWPRHDETEWPHSGPMPDDPVTVRPHRYESITKGLQSYRPVQPMPWGDVNRRVAPPGSLPSPPLTAAPVPLAAPSAPPKPAMPSHGNPVGAQPKQ